MNKSKPPAALSPTYPAELLQIPQVGPALSAAQKKFNQLLKQIATARQDLAQWQEQQQALREQLTRVLAPSEQALNQAERDLALELDAILLTPPTGLKLTAKRKKGLETYLMFLVSRLLESAPNDVELQALHDRHSSLDLETIRKEDQAFEREIAEESLREIFGDEIVDDIELTDDLDELFDRAQAKAQAQRDAAPEPKLNKRAQAAANKRKADEDALAQSLREIYRKLASSLHPDREADSERREQKTLLMQRINVAYQANDLLSLLSLQMEVEQISSASLGQVPPQRLNQYNQILREQLEAIQTQRQSLFDQLYATFPSVRPRRVPVIAEFFAAIKHQARDRAEMTHALHGVRANLRNPKLRLSAIDQVVRIAKEIEAKDQWLARELDDIEQYF